MSEDRIEIGPYDYLEYFMTKAALLVSMDEKGKTNAMALLWKMIGELWMIPIITVAVAPSRYTFELLTRGVKEFTVNIPSNKIEDAINTTGSLSGRDVDKFKEAGLETIKGKRTKVPTIKDCILSYECKIRHECKSGSMAPHSLFFGEILTAYASKEIVH
jgi:flavin reductase (DIM6/NTAB) family NADH-FMN oxidoreductase RutF